MIQKLVLPKLTWGAQYQTLTEKEIEKMDNKVEAVINQCVMRSPALGKITAGAKYMPSFGIQYSAIRHEQWRCKRQAKQRETGRLGTKEEETIEKWGWVKIEKGRYDTPRGIIDITRDGRATIMAAAEQAWQDSLWKADNRANDEESTRIREEKRTVVEEHIAYAKKGDKQRLRAAIAVTMDDRAAPWLNKKRRSYYAQGVCAGNQRQEDNTGCGNAPR